MQTVGRTMTTHVSAPIGLAAGAAVKFAADYDKALTNAVSVTGLQGSAADKAKGQMDQLATSLGQKTAFSAQDAANAMYDLASSGWKTQQMTQGLPGIMDLASSTQSDLGMTTESVTATLAQFGLGASSSGRVADVFTKAIGSSKANMDRLSGSMKYVGPIAHSTGMSLEETTAVLSKLYDAGFEGEQAGTALRGALSQLMNPTGQASAALKDLGLSAEDVNPKTHSLADILKTLQGAGMDTNTAIQLFGRESAPAMLALANQSGGIDNLTKSLEKSGGTAHRVATDQLDTLSGQAQILKGSVETLGIAVGKSLLPPLTSIARFLTPIVNAFAGLPAPIRTGIVMFGLLVAAVGPVVWIMGSMVSSAGALMGAFADFREIGGIAGLLARFGGAARGLGVAFRLLMSPLGLVTRLLPLLGAGLAFLVSPIGLVLVAVAALAAGAYLIYRNWGPISAWFGRLWKSLPAPVRGALSTVGGILKNGAGVVRGVLTGDWGSAVSSAKKLWRGLPSPVRQSISRTGDELRLGGNIIRGIFTGNWQPAVKSAHRLWNDLPAPVRRAAGAVGGALRGGARTVGGIFSGMWRGSIGIGERLWNGLPAPVHRAAGQVGNTLRLQGGILRGIFTGNWSTAISAGKALFNSLPPGVRSRLQPLGSVVTGIGGILRSAFTGNWGGAVAQGKRLFDSLPPSVRQKITPAVGITRAVGGAILGVFRGDWGGAVALGQRVFDALPPGVRSRITPAVGITRGVGGMVLAAFRGDWGGAARAGQAVFDSLPAGVRSRISPAVGFVSGTGQQIFSTVSGWGGHLYQLGADAIQGLVNGIKSMGGAAASAVGGLLRGAKEAGKRAINAHSPSRDFEQLGQWTGQGYIGGIERMASSVRDSVSRMMYGALAAARAGNIQLSRELQRGARSAQMEYEALRHVADAAHSGGGVEGMKNQIAALYSARRMAFGAGDMDRARALDFQANKMKIGLAKMEAGQPVHRQPAVWSGSGSAPRPSAPSYSTASSTRIDVYFHGPGAEHLDEEQVASMLSRQMRADRRRS